MIYTRLSTVTVSDGTSVDLPDAGVTLFVGPNNAGKSQLCATSQDCWVSRNSTWAGRSWACNWISVEPRKISSPG